jgi:hypothetical protein
MVVRPAGFSTTTTSASAWRITTPAVFPGLFRDFR